MFSKKFKKEMSMRTGLTMIEVHNFLVDYYELMNEYFVEMEVGDRMEIREYGYYEKTLRKQQVIKSISGKEEKLTNPFYNIKFKLSPTTRAKFERGNDNASEEERR